MLKRPCNFGLIRLANLETQFQSRKAAVLSMHSGLSELFDERSENAIFSAEPFAFTQPGKGCVHIELYFVFHVSFLLL